MTPLTYTKTQSNITWRIEFHHDTGYLAARTKLPDDETLQVSGFTKDEGWTGDWGGFISGSDRDLGRRDDFTIYHEALDHFAGLALGDGVL